MYRIDFIAQEIDGGMESRSPHVQFPRHSADVLLRFGRYCSGYYRRDSQQHPAVLPI